ncbi:MAG: TauD/TfdA family dioxygenase [Roseiarcus sp.]
MTVTRARFAPSGRRPGGDPFDLDDEASYRAWRDAKLARYPRRAEDLVVEIRDPALPSAAEREAIAERCGRANAALYVFTQAPRDERSLRRDLIAFGAAFGLTAIEDHRSAEADGVVSIEVVRDGGRLGYIPYTDRPISWHTDGYYNYHGPERCVRAMLLHCARDADAGGENRLLDPEVAYLRLRDLDAGHIEALMHPQAMSIPANVEPDGAIRAENVGPVFFVHPGDGALGMRYTARKRNISWRDDERTRRAVAALEQILETDPLVLRLRMQPGQGLICNNILHDRTGFVSSAPAGRLLYRIRYHGRIAAGA